MSEVLLLITVLALVALPPQHPFDWDRYNARQGPWGARAGRDVWRSLISVVHDAERRIVAGGYVFNL